MHRKPMHRKRVRITLFRFAGRWLFFRIKNACQECDITYTLLQRLLANELKGKPISLRILPWLSNWWKVIWVGGWHAPILTVNGRVFSQGGVPDIPSLLRKVGRLLNDSSLIEASKRPRKKEPLNERDFASCRDFVTERDPVSETVVFHSPACPHCRQLVGYLKANNVSFVLRDVTASESARREIFRLTGRLSIPVMVVRGEVVTGFDRQRLRDLLGISEERAPVEQPREALGVPEFDAVRLEAIQQKARDVLQGNWLNGWTKPSGHLYPHQWYWDSGFVARGYLHYAPERAYREIGSLLKAQWSDGFLPHVVFNPSYLDHFPGPEYWQAQRSGRVPKGLYTSGLSQPPVVVSMIAEAANLDPDRSRAEGFLREVYPKLKSLHEYLFEFRDPFRENLVYVAHPWESGLDNAPLWDEPLAAIERETAWSREMQRRYDELAESGDRPKRTYISKYSYLIENLFTQNYDWNRIAQNHPFQIQDVLFNVILCRAERDLGKIAEIIGAGSDAHFDRAEKIKDAVNSKLWDETQGLYYDYDLISGKMIRKDTIFSYMPLFAGIPNEQRGRKLLDNLRTHCFCVADGDCVAVPSYDMCQVDYQGEFYWRGPVWVNINWYLAQGVREFGEEELADWIERSLITLVDRHGFYEYFDPDTGKGLGASEFSWTAALIIDLVARRNGSAITNRP